MPWRQDPDRDGTGNGAQAQRHGRPFDHKPDGSYVLNREAAHGLARVARVGGDLAGKAILEAVVHPGSAGNAYRHLGTGFLPWA